MIFLQDILHLVFHLDQSLEIFFNHHGNYIFPLLFSIIFAETGFVFFAFLPGDGLLFTLGVLATTVKVSIIALVATLILAAILGNISNYVFGRTLGRKRQFQNIIPGKYLKRANRFFDVYGSKAVFFARFMPYIRSIIPFIAGLTYMSGKKFISFTLIGAIVWVPTFIYAGFYLGHIDFVHRHYLWIVYLMMLSSWVPLLVKFLKRKILLNTIQD